MADMKGIQGELSSMMPQADQSFGQISDLIGGIMSESGQIPNAELGGVRVKLRINEDYRGGKCFT